MCVRQQDQQWYPEAQTREMVLHTCIIHCPPVHSIEDGVQLAGITNWKMMRQKQGPLQLYPPLLLVGAMPLLPGSSLPLCDIACPDSMRQTVINEASFPRRDEHVEGSLLLTRPYRPGRMCLESITRSSLLAALSNLKPPVSFTV